MNRPPIAARIAAGDTGRDVGRDSGRAEAMGGDALSAPPATKGPAPWSRPPGGPPIAPAGHDAEPAGATS